MRIPGVRGLCVSSYVIVFFLLVGDNIYVNKQMNGFPLGFFLAFLHVVQASQRPHSTRLVDVPVNAIVWCL